jgi:hypothetical protein
MHGVDLLNFIILKQRLALRFKFEQTLNFVERLSGVVDVLLGKLTGTFVFEDRRISVGFGLDLQDGGLGSKSDVIGSCLGFINSSKCFIQDHLLFGNLSCNDRALIDIWQINLHEEKVNDLCMSTFEIFTQLNLKIVTKLGPVDPILGCIIVGCN